MADEKKERTNEDRKEMAQRQLDGMTVNRDLMAKDVLFLVRQNGELSKMMAEQTTLIADLTSRFVELQSQFNTLRQQSMGGLADAFADIFKQPEDPKKPH